MPHPDRARTATGIVRAYMRMLNFQGLATPWQAIYAAPGFEQDEQLLRHEQCHLDQMKRDGTILFLITYLVQIIRYGYWGAPYEIEARLAETP